MFELEWSNAPRWRKERDVGSQRPTALDPADVETTLLLHWQEHCVECAPPVCYDVCPLYVARADQRCARLVYGVVPNRRYQGLFDHGADVRFRRWGKLESKLYGTQASVAEHRRLDRLDQKIAARTRKTAELLERVEPTGKLSHKLVHWRDKALHRHGTPGDFDEFVLEVHAPDPDPPTLILEVVEREAVTSRHAFALRQGHNFHTVPAAAFPTHADGRILLYPDDDAECRLIFTWLDLVRYRRRPPRPVAAEQVKVVAWDLDDTLWAGTLLDGDVTLDPRVRPIIEALDARGILQTIVSKNDHDPAWAQVVASGLDEFFLATAINWAPKSANLQSVAARLNLGIDAFALIDNSAFERAEVVAALPQVRTYDPAVDLSNLLDRSEFDVPVTVASAGRRESYRAQAQREAIHARFDGDYEAFLRSCAMTLRLFRPSSEAEIQRCLELAQRSNQLNLSKRSFTEQSFRALLATPGTLAVGWECADRFGHYGIVGFASVEEDRDVPLVRDYVLSCRVAQKRVEHAFFGWLAARERARGKASLAAELVRTDRNHALVQVFAELPFTIAEQSGERTRFELFTASAPQQDVIAVTDAT